MTLKLLAADLVPPYLTVEFDKLAQDHVDFNILSFMLRQKATIVVKITLKQNVRNS